MKIILAAIAIAFATPAASQSAAQPAGHAGHPQGQQHQGQSEHREGQRHDCPCCRPAADGQRPGCCARMQQQRQQQQDGEQHQGRDNH